ncbi:pentatricopeptide repeat-containing protein At4g01990, mitochondrial-like [Silene latifolia]|uniref:pentatricopeptide repeat-containing protein At4g01990, mitochondrial-like n=1 Tax=Silene latifolia TaxID=37657 RepID=UPI003D76C88C
MDFQVCSFTFSLSHFRSVALVGQSYHSFTDGVAVLMAVMFNMCSGNAILDWFEKRTVDPLGRDLALRLDMLYKFKGLAEAENYFDSIPSAFKNKYVYGSLLSCYCADLETDKALATFKRMDELGFASHHVAFNNILNLYVKTKPPEKVPDDWQIYCNVVSVFIEFGQFDKAASHLEKLEKFLDSSHNPSRNAVEHLFSLYAGAGKLDSVIQTWNKFKSKYKVANKHYLLLFQALSRLDDIKGLENYFREWESTCKNYNDIIPAVLIGARGGGREVAIWAIALHDLRINNFY